MRAQRLKPMSLTRTVTVRCPSNMYGSSETAARQSLVKTSAAAFSESHIYQQPGRYTVTLAVTDKLGRMTEESHEVLVQTAQEEHKEETGGGGDAGGGQKHAEGGGTASSGQTASSVQTGGGVSVQATHDPDATLASTSLTASSSGAFTVRVACPSGETGCSGTVTLHTLARRGYRRVRRAKEEDEEGGLDPRGRLICGRRWAGQGDHAASVGAGAEAADALTCVARTGYSPGT